MKFKHIRTGAILEPHSDFVLEQFQKSPDLIPFDEPEPDAATGGDKPLSKFTKDELLEMAQEAGIAVPDGAKKAEIIDLIEALKQNGRGRRKVVYHAARNPCFPGRPDRP